MGPRSAGVTAAEPGGFGQSCLARAGAPIA